MSRRLFIASLFDGCLVDKHYRDVVADRINTFTLNALQHVSIRLQIHFRLASRTREYFQEFLTNCHGLDLSKALLRECRKLITKTVETQGSLFAKSCFTQRRKVFAKAQSRSESWGLSLRLLFPLRLCVKRT